jgi:hypothetical protein
MILLKLNLRFSGEDHRRHPYILIMHTISNRNFEIHIFALLTFRRKFQDVTRTVGARGRAGDGAWGRRWGEKATIGREEFDIYVPPSHPTVPRCCSSLSVRGAEGVGQRRGRYEGEPWGEEEGRDDGRGRVWGEMGQQDNGPFGPIVALRELNKPLNKRLSTKKLF